jgi:hypothetical protein
LVGENLAMNFTSPESVHKALMFSPSHKKNILNGEYKDIGLAVLNGTIDGKETSVLVELFSIRKEEKLLLASTIPVQEEIIKPQEEISEIKNEIIPNISSVNENKIDVISEINNQEQEKNIPNLELIASPPKLPDFKNIIENNLSLAKSEVLASELTRSDIQKKQKEKEVFQLSQVSSVSEDVESNNLYKAKVFANNQDDAKTYTEAKLQYINYFLFAILLALSAFLIINILIRIEVQHKHVIIQAIFLIIFIAGLISLKFNFLASVLPKILIV